jgi:hypothetical protein
MPALLLLLLLLLQLQDRRRLEHLSTCLLLLLQPLRWRCEP